MHINWNDPKQRPFKPGDFYIGVDPDTGQEIGVKPDTAALTCAKSRTGKGAGVMIPNLLRWPDSALVIDPKGEAAEATAEARETLFGMPSYVLDPFGYCDIPDRLRARFNPLDEIDLTARGAREDILTLADGIIMRHDPRSEHWEGGGAGYLAGLIAYIADKAPPEKRNLQEVASLINLGREEKEQLWSFMAQSDAVGKLVRDAAQRMLSSPKEAQHFDSVVKGNTSWLSSDEIAPILQDSTFRLSDLRTKGATVYLVLPPDMIEAHPHFLRLFVMAAIRAMGRHKDGRRCLFLLDEFYALGHIAKTDKAAGLLPGFGVHLWIFLQNMGQLGIYGQEGAEAFIENADLLQFFGLGPGKSAQFVSALLGQVDLSQMEAPPSPITEIDFMLGAMSFLSQTGRRTKKTASRKTTRIKSMTPLFLDGVRFLNEAAKQQQMHEYQHHMRLHGTPRVSPDEVVELIKKDGSALARGQICWIKGAPYLLGLAPWFQEQNSSRNSSEPSAISFNAGPALQRSILGIEPEPTPHVSSKNSSAAALRKSILGE